MEELVIGRDEFDSSIDRSLSLSDSDDISIDQDQQSDVSEEEEECRVCRGPAEEGRQLFAPCKCSGSIGFTHQDCLSEWLAVTRGSGRCELCSHRFQFAPKYAPNTPDFLSPIEVFLGLSRRAVARWLPFALRVTVAAALWLLVVPLATAYLYHAWMKRPSTVVQRFKWELIAGDTVSGAVCAAVIIVSFLSLMSFADFLRFHWQQQARQQRLDDAQDDANNNIARVGGIAGNNEMNDGHIDHDNNNVNDDADEDIDDVILDHEKFVRRQQQLLHPVGVMDQREPLFSENNRRHVRWVDLAPEEQEPMRMRPAGLPHDPEEQRQELERRIRAVEALRRQLDEVNENDQRVEDFSTGENQNNEPDALVARLPLQLDHDENEERIAEAMNGQEDEPILAREPLEEQADQQHAHEQEEPIFPERRNNDRFEPQFEPLDPVINQADDQADREIHMALDELLGLQGPVDALFRNLLWLLAFNATYLGIFAYIPRVVGSIIYSKLLNTGAVLGILNRIPFFSSELWGDRSLQSIVLALNTESKRLNTSLQLPELATVALGYFSMASTILLWHFGIIISRKISRRTGTRPTRGQPREDQQVVPNRPDRVNEGENVGDPRPEANSKLALVVECAAAIVKVGILLFLKMLLLPLVLGVWLDVATLSLFSSAVDSRVIYAGGDLFGSALLHWVVGITFMLLVTVSVLQLREVAHPDLLARIIRPQEPQPDLLGNLLQESGYTHAKRMFLSLAIYAVLLTMHVWLPSCLLEITGIGQYLPFTRPRFWHPFLPQLQVPVELLIFHLIMLALLEKYKNRIGEMQHKWLYILCEKMGMTEHVLPQTVGKFVLVGSRPVFKAPNDFHIHPTEITQSGSASPNGQFKEASSGLNTVDKFWYDLATTPDILNDQFVLVNVDTISPTDPPQYETGRTKRSGERVLSTPQSFIRLPQPPPSSSDRAKKLKRKRGRNDEASAKCLLPTNIGSYRLKRRLNVDGTLVIEFWREIAGEPIPRPPEGWDDLGEGGAEVQGRWAWGKEKKSKIEAGIAKRTNFLRRENSWASTLVLVAKLLLLVLLSWLAVTVVLCTVLSAPLLVGRFYFFLLRIPDKCLHDPLSFAIGGITLFPVLRPICRFMISLAAGNSPPMRLLQWISAFRMPPTRKLLVVIMAAVLWLLVAPLVLGVLYGILLIKPSHWPSFTLSWGVGTMLLNGWAALCYIGVFNGKFWKEVAVGALDGDQNNNNNNEQVHRDNAEEANDNNERPGQEEEDDDDEEFHEAMDNIYDDKVEDHVMVSWQGENGRIAKCISILMDIWLEWQWDRVDHTYLLDDCILPVTRLLVTSVIIPSMVFGVWIFALRLSSAPSINNGDFGFRTVSRHIFSADYSDELFLVIAYRTLTCMTLAVQLVILFQKPLKKWFHVAHQAARDDRYLVGEILMNYQ